MSISESHPAAIKTVNLSLHFEVEDNRLNGRNPSLFFRTILGKNLRDIACVCPREKEGLHDEICIYRKIIEPSLNPQHALDSSVQSPPPPFTYYCTKVQQRRFVIHLVLLKAAENYLNYFVFAYLRMCQQKLGKDKIGLTLKNILLENEENKSIFDTQSTNLTYTPRAKPIEIIMNTAACDYSLELITPLHLKEHGQVLEQLTLLSLVNAIVRRVSIVSRVYGEMPLNISKEDIINHCQVMTLTCSGKTYTQKKERFSRRQKRSMDIGGIMGTFIIRNVPPELQRFFQLAETLHIGKKSSFSNGKFKLKQMIEKG